MPEYTKEVVSGVPGKNLESPKRDDGGSLLTNENPVREPPGPRSEDGEAAVHSMAYPSLEPACVMLSVHPAGAVTLLGELSKKSSKGTHANQNVPMVVEPVSSRVMVYWVSPEGS
jgi:hypothetical protein